MPVVYLITWIICYCATLFCAARPDIGPIHVFPTSKNKKKGRQFVWEASLDSMTRIGSSKETSVLHWSSHYEDERDSIASMKRVSQKLVESYPTWLAKGSVTFGLLHARRQQKQQHDKDEIVLQPKFINFNLLSFGKTKVIRVNRRRIELKIPVTGGFFSAEHGRERDRGCLTFQVIRKEVKKDEDDKSCCHFCTTISGDYRPTIAAGRGDRRKWAYLSSQSLVHAYVMWRFHRVWNKRVRYIC